MLAATHTLAGAAIGTVIPHPFFSFFLGLLSHYFLDTFPHWNLYVGNNNKNSFPYFGALADLGIGIFFSLIFLRENILQFSIILGIFGANLPDIISALWSMLRFPKKNIFFRFHRKIQKETQNIAYGLISQIIVWVLAIIIFIFYSNG